ncbi:esterase/lipase family protein [Caenimonas soli]|uniref:esterase/lipase family protein n=1 Tax=Caenimonas soli TaxID=2735555 RepID=UPI0015570915|nr:alpha/beta fold hydrolase [Caenimonas soli]NPC58142.1 alpha/beta fold hydrolase [Caenimonas soli]
MSSPPHSALARLQQVITVSLLCGALAWLVWHWRDSPLLALAGFLTIVLGYSLFLAVEFVALRFVGRGDSVPQPTWAELGRAWLGETVMAPRVFCWRQPFRWRVVPDALEIGHAQRGRRGAVFIHGFVCNRGFWNPWLERLRASGNPFIAVNLEPVFGSIEDYAATIEDAVLRMTQATGLPPVLICHSMGGVAARAWLRAKSPDACVHHVITIGSPHHGTWLGHFSHLENGRQMRLRNPWLQELAVHSEQCRDIRFTCWYSNCDNIVFPASTATLAGADNRLVRGVAHVDLAFHPAVMGESLAIVTSA